MQNPHHISADPMTYYRERAHAERAQAIRAFFRRIAAAKRQHKSQQEMPELCSQGFTRHQAG